jgi:hypothetical protein
MVLFFESVDMSRELQNVGTELIPLIMGLYFLEKCGCNWMNKRCIFDQEM